MTYVVELPPKNPIYSISSVADREPRLINVIADGFRIEGTYVVFFTEQKATGYVGTAMIKEDIAIYTNFVSVKKKESNG